MLLILEYLEIKALWSGSLEPEKIVWSDIKGEKKILERRSKLLTASKKSLNRFKAGHPDGFIEAYANFYNEIFDEFNFFKKIKKIQVNLNMISLILLMVF